MVVTSYPLAQILWNREGTGRMVKWSKFIKDLVAYFGVPNRIITNNGTQFTRVLFGDYCEDMNIKLCFAFVAHPKSDGQAERANVEVLKGLKTRTYNELKKHGTR